jgi:lysine 6-dehydrogenase
MPFRYDGRIPTMEYKTLRYPGHAQIMTAIRELGLLGLEPVDVKGSKVVPRDVFIATAGPRLTRDAPDLVALRVEVSGSSGGTPRRLVWELIDRADEERGISAMMRTTGYSLSITGQMQVRGEVRPLGAHTPDECVPAPRYIEELAKRGIEIKESSAEGRRSRGEGSRARHARK